MLALEKEKEALKIILRQRQYRWNPLFWNSFAFAVAFHGVGALLFHIHPLFVSDGHFLPPLQVEIVANEEEGKEVAGMPNEEEESSLIALLPRLSKPTLSSITLSPAPIDVESSTTALSPYDHPFKAMEGHWETVCHKECQNSKEPTTALLITGELADRPLINSGLAGIQGHCGSSLYEVRVEGKTGRVFWYLSQQERQDPKFQAIAESVIKQLRFSADPSVAIARGFIEISHD
jgi:hypothetical protein